MQTLATTTGSEQGCELSENDTSSEISQNPPLCVPDKHRAAWAFEWKVIRRRACHGSQRAASTCKRCLLQQESLQTFPGVFPLVASAFKAEGMSEPPHGEAGILRGLWWRWRLSLGVVGGFSFPHRLHGARLPGAAAAGPTATLDEHFGCAIFCNSMNSRTKSGWGTFHCPSNWSEKTTNDAMKVLNIH